MKKTKDESYMLEAIKQAEKALAAGEVPIGAVVVGKNGEIFGRGYNKMEQMKCQTEHAEMIAIKKACKKVGDWRLDGCSIYVTLEPCVMCFGLIQLSRIKKLVFGAKSPLFGFGYESKKFHLMKKDLEIKHGICENECKAQLKNFFKGVRNKKDVK
jgi:tRNA(adenine34) deaminase